MEKCRVCYSEVRKDKVEVHVQLCGEVAKLRKDIEAIIEKMEEYSRHAYLKQSSLNTNASAQKYSSLFCDPHLTL